MASHSTVNGHPRPAFPPVDAPPQPGAVSPRIHLARIRGESYRIDGVPPEIVDGAPCPTPVRAPPHPILLRSEEHRARIEGILGEGDRKRDAAPEGNPRLRAVSRPVDVILHQRVERLPVSRIEEQTLHIPSPEAGILLHPGFSAVRAPEDAERRRCEDPRSNRPDPARSAEDLLGPPSREHLPGQAEVRRAVHPVAARKVERPCGPCPV